MLGRAIGSSIPLSATGALSFALGARFYPQRQRFAHRLPRQRAGAGGPGSHRVGLSLRVVARLLSAGSDHLKAAVAGEGAESAEEDETAAPRAAATPGTSFGDCDEPDESDRGSSEAVRVAATVSLCSTASSAKLLRPPRLVQQG